MTNEEPLPYPVIPDWMPGAFGIALITLGGMFTLLAVFVIINVVRHPKGRDDLHAQLWGYVVLMIATILLAAGTGSLWVLLGGAGVTVMTALALGRHVRKANPKNTQDREDSDHDH